MGRRRKKGRPVNGWLILDKPYDVGSTEAVGRVRWLFDANKAGHAGTLDPLATGILPIALGEATKTVPFVQDGEKTYRFTARWGEATTTDDTEGEVTATSAVRPSREEIEAALPDFTGEIDQVPPAFSAIKVDGERAYDLARDGEKVELEARIITVHDFRLVDIPDADHAVFEAVTGKGTYVRALVRDLARALGTEAHVSTLRRTAVGPFTEDMAVTIEDLTGKNFAADVHRDMLEQETLDSFLEPVESALAALPSAAVSGGDSEKLRRGQAVIVQPPVAKGIRGERVGEIEAVLAMHHDDAVAICRLDGLKLQPVRVFQQEEA